MLARYVKRTSLQTRGALRELTWDVWTTLRSFSPGAEPPWTWERFHREVRARGGPLLARLGEFADSVLVAGCQRSGTTMLTRVLLQSDGIVDYRTRADEELEAALILSGVQPHVPRGRYCFQTTYLNERWREYCDAPPDFRLLWVLRNPFSVVFSMKYNWERFAFDELFEACGATLLSPAERARYGAIGPLAVSRTRRACLSYVARELQALELAAALGDRMLVVDYDEMVRGKHRALPAIYEFIGLPYQRRYADLIHERSLAMAELLPAADRATIEQLCEPVYRKVHALAARF